MNQSDKIQDLLTISYDIGIFTNRIKRYDMLLIASRSYPYQIMERIKSRQNKTHIILDELKKQYDEALETIKAIPTHETNSYNHYAIRQELLSWYNINLDLHLSKSRKHEAVITRQFMMSCDRVFTKLSLREIGAMNGHKDHATALHANKEIRNILDCKDEKSLRLIEFAGSFVVNYKGERKTIYDHLKKLL